MASFTMIPTKREGRKDGKIISETNKIDVNTKIGNIKEWLQTIAWLDHRLLYVQVKDKE